MATSVLAPDEVSHPSTIPGANRPTANPSALQLKISVFDDGQSKPRLPLPCRAVDTNDLHGLSHTLSSPVPAIRGERTVTAFTGRSRQRLHRRARLA